MKFADKLAGEWRDRAGGLPIGRFAEQPGHSIFTRHVDLFGSHGFTIPQPLTLGTTAIPALRMVSSEDSARSARNRISTASTRA